MSILHMKLVFVKIGEIAICSMREIPLSLWCSKLIVGHFSERLSLSLS
jgi:hypothetical protein